MPPSYTAAMTELQAVNTMLGSIGEAPLADGTDLSVQTQDDIVMALAVLRKKARDTMLTRWKFNTEFGYEITRTATYSWVDTAGVTTSLGIFKPPANLASFRVSQIAAQIGSKAIDAALRRSRKYVETVPVIVFYDRAKNRDGFPTADRTYLYIDPVWYITFEDLPDSARAYISLAAARTFQNSVVGSSSLNRFTQEEEDAARLILENDQGLEDDYNLFNNYQQFEFLGGRYSGSYGMMDTRNSPGPT
jgi:hypothetical protein